MTVKKILAIANRAYSDDLVKLAADGVDTGDTLAEFICRELCSIYDVSGSDIDQLTQAFRVMEKARHELEKVERAFRFELDFLRRKHV